MSNFRKQALDYHSATPRGKIAIQATKPCATQDDLSLAYSPGVAEPCLEIQKNIEDSYLYTSRANLVAVITNGTAVLGLGDIGAAAAKPVMEGKAVLFKRFAGIDAIDLEIDEKDPEKFIQIVKSLQYSFGGINLEDIKAPECFEIEERLKAMMDIPVFHDDQHGTAIITTAGLINALEVTGKSVKNIKVVFSGAGAAGITCAKMVMSLGVPKDNIFLIDRQGLVTKDRPNLEAHRGLFAKAGPAQSLAQVMCGADVFVGVSTKNLVTPEMLKSMQPNPIVFAMANPDPEVAYSVAKAARADLIMATGRSDFPNQVNNVLGFPFIFRGALDTQSRHINEAMKMAAAQALAKLAKEPVPFSVKMAYGVEHLEFGVDYIIPKPFDPRVLVWVASAVAETATRTGVARKPLLSVDDYQKKLQRLSDEIFSTVASNTRV